MQNAATLAQQVLNKLVSAWDLVDRGRSTASVSYFFFDPAAAPIILTPGNHA